MPSRNVLPSARDFVTQLLDSLRAASLPHPQDAAADDNTAANTLTKAPDAVKKYLLALHVLFPNELLPALDLLDRTLVTRFRILRERNEQRVEQPASAARNATAIQGHEHGHTTPHESSHRPHLPHEQAMLPAEATSAPRPTPTPGAGHTSPSAPAPPDAEMTDRSTEQPAPDTLRDTDIVYYVRSAQHRHSRFSTSYESTTSYEVRLRAWNCSCPAFAFSAFPSILPEPSMPLFAPKALPSLCVAENGEEKWSFGGLSLGHGTPSVCKHLLACVLVERCGDLFGGFVEEVSVGSAEAAGWAAGWGD